MNSVGNRNSPGQTLPWPCRPPLDGRYILEFPVAYAASGTAWSALDTFTDGPRRVVVKFVQHVVNGDPNDLVLLRARQASIRWGTARALPLIEALGGFDAAPFLVFAWPNGDPLNQFLRSAGPGTTLPYPAVLAFAKSIAALHDARLLHLDLAPTSIVYDSSARELRLIDWGHALPVEQTFTTLLARIASSAYAGIGMQSGNVPTMRDDVYSAACLIYELLSGRHPYGRHTSTEAAACQLKFTPIAQLSAPANVLFARALDPSQHQPAVTMAELVEALANGARETAANAKRRLTTAPIAAPALRRIGGTQAPMAAEPAQTPRAGVTSPHPARASVTPITPLKPLITRRSTPTSINAGRRTPQLRTPRAY